MPIATTLFVLVGALGIEAAFGYPRRLYRTIGHPVTWIGALIGKLDRRLNRENETATARKISGVLTLMFVIVVSAGIAWIIERALAPSLIGQLALAAVAST